MKNIYAKKIQQQIFSVSVFAYNLRLQGIQISQ
jgi:hypothetical protein